MPSHSTSRVKKPAPPRKKACQSCTAAKVRCGLQKPACSRCRARGKQCQYPTGNVGLHANDPVSHKTISFHQSGDDGLFLGNLSVSSVETLLDSEPVDASTPQAIPSQRGTRSGSAHPRVEANLDFENIDLAPMVDAEEIRDRWLRPYLFTSMGQVPKLFHPFTVQYLTCVLRSYPGYLLDLSHAPPFIHPRQLASKRPPQALANCFNLARMWMNRVPGSERMIISTVQQEMARLVTAQNTVGDFDHLCSLQAYLIYLIISYFFPIDANNSLVNDSAMVTLQEQAFHAAKAGVSCTTEVSRTRPNWESWIVASAKRRTLFTMYLFSSVYNAQKGLPNFVADELSSLAVPEGKALWEAPDRGSWEREYNRHLSRWEDGILKISELWRSSQTGSEERRKRIERWLQSADEFGMMLFAVCAHIHGC
ncbi:hypothetical protein NUU61_003552 [Penicillium alfredii]|uniref:Zn(2)-C6 fungal-type domain-containing protein n=1 Tax=Penicillium alfredii TaxID=1506179 RepID=A0A9W9FJM4_9EURO|nr:uncharacterized protein NUU61_003552 [Penicillium alfredii]KAJ5101330.1 hypothetical protein NUU61_003552 [Penicillium alfredii]